MSRLRNTLRVLFGRVDLDHLEAKARYFRAECIRARERVEQLKDQIEVLKKTVELVNVPR